MQRVMARKREGYGAATLQALKVMATEMTKKLMIGAWLGALFYEFEMFKILLQTHSFQVINLFRLRLDFPCVCTHLD